MRLAIALCAALTLLGCAPRNASYSGYPNDGSDLIATGLAIMNARRTPTYTLPMPTQSTCYPMAFGAMHCTTY